MLYKNLNHFDCHFCQARNIDKKHKAMNLSVNEVSEILLIYPL